ncbi:MAG: addiction module toxin, HicA family [Acidobacteria bacterium]|nr:addiction module toxin, HicA family [Acidobacteriota bacterium]
MSRLPVVGYQVMESLLLGLGFEKKRQRGSHVFFRHTDGRTTTVPNHKGRDLARTLIREILREIELSPDEFVRLLG